MIVAILSRDLKKLSRGWAELVLFTCKMAEEQTVSHVHVSSAAVPIPRNSSQESISSSPTTARLNWKLAVKKAKEMSDSWEKFHFDTIPARKARRYIYDPRRRVWLKDKNHIVIKMQDEVRDVVCWCM